MAELAACITISLIYNAQWEEKLTVREVNISLKLDSFFTFKKWRSDEIGRTESTYL